MKLILMAKGLKRKQTTNDKKVKISYEGHNLNYKDQGKLEKFDDIKNIRQVNQSNRNRRSHQTVYVKSPTIFESKEDKLENKRQRNRKSNAQINKSNKNNNVDSKNIDLTNETKKGPVMTSNTKKNEVKNEVDNELVGKKTPETQETPEECLDTSWSSQIFESFSENEKACSKISTKETSCTENSTSNLENVHETSSSSRKKTTKMLKKSRKSIIALRDAKEEKNLSVSVCDVSAAPEEPVNTKYRYHRKFSVRNSMYDIALKSLRNNDEKSEKAANDDNDTIQGEYIGDVSVRSQSSNQETNAECQNYRKFSIRNSLFDVKDESLETDSESKDVRISVTAIIDDKHRMSGIHQLKDYNIDASETSTSSKEETNAQCQNYRKFSVRNSMFDVINESLDSDSETKDESKPVNAAHDKDGTNIIQGLNDLSKGGQSYGIADFSQVSTSSARETNAECQNYRKFSVRNSMFDVINESLDSDGETKEESKPVNAAHDKDERNNIQALNDLHKKGKDYITTDYSQTRTSSEQDLIAECQNYRKFSMRNSMWDVINESLDSDDKPIEPRPSLVQAKNGQRNEIKDASRQKRYSPPRSIGLLCAERYRSKEDEKEKTPRPIKLRLFNYSTKFEEQYIVNYSKRLSIERKQSQSCLRRLLKGPKRGNILDTVSDNTKRLFRFHLPLSYYHGVEED